MAKIVKKDLARGVKLTSDHWNENKSQVETLLSGQIDAENQVLNNGKFSMTYNWPRLNAECFAYTNQTETTATNYEVESQGIYAVILLPPTQDQWTQTIGVSSMPVLKSLSVSFDTYMNNVGVTSERVMNDTGNLVPVADSASKYTLNLEIREKDQTGGVAASTSTRAQNIAAKTIYKTSVAGQFFNGSVVRFNPFFVDGIDKIFNPTKTYLMKIDFPSVYGLEASPLRFTPVSLTVKLDFETRMVERDRRVAITYPLQNYPTSQQETIPTFALDTAVAGQKITARAGVAANGRIQTNLESIDNVLVSGIQSGNDLRSYPAIDRRVINDASYFCMVVPMFGGFLDIRSSDLNTEGLPYGPQGVFGGDPANPETQFWKGSL